MNQNKKIIRSFLLINVLSIFAALIFTIIVELMLRTGSNGVYLLDVSRPMTVMALIVYFAICSFLMWKLAFKLFLQSKAKYFSAFLWIAYALILMVIIARIAPVQETPSPGLGIIMMIMGLGYAAMLIVAYGVCDALKGLQKRSE